MSSVLCLVLGGASAATSTGSSNVKYGLQDNCYANQPGKFNICLDLSSPSGGVEDWMGAFINARDTWEQVVTYNGIDVSSSGFDTSYTATNSYPPTIDGLYISSSVTYMDGPGGILGSGGPIYLSRSGANVKAVTGKMTFDSADVNSMLGKGNLNNVILHEMAHVLGVGT